MLLPNISRVDGSVGIRSVRRRAAEGMAAVMDLLIMSSPSVFLSKLCAEVALFRLRSVSTTSEERR